MNKQENEIFDAYVEAYNLAQVSYKMMGQMLDAKYMQHRIDLAGINEVIIYGGGYLGVQLYHAMKNLLSVKAVVDKNGSAVVDVEGMPIISLDDMKKMYRNEKVIVTPINYYKAIKDDLCTFVKEEDVYFLGEFLEGDN